MVQAIANLMDSPGALKRYAEPARPREIAAAAKARGIGVMGIRAVQAGALTAAIDRPLSANNPDNTDYRPRRAVPRASAPSGARTRRSWPTAMRSGMPDIDTVVLGVKNRAELAQCLAGEAAGPLEPAQVAAIDALGLAEAQARYFPFFTKSAISSAISFGMLQLHQVAGVVDRRCAASRGSAPGPRRTSPGRRRCRGRRS